jgi:hypothetical protein
MSDPETYVSVEEAAVAFGVPVETVMAALARCSLHDPNGSPEVGVHDYELRGVRLAMHRRLLAAPSTDSGEGTAP